MSRFTRLLLGREFRRLKVSSVGFPVTDSVGVSVHGRVVSDLVCMGVAGTALPVVAPFSVSLNRCTVREESLALPASVPGRRAPLKKMVFFGPIPPAGGRSIPLCALAFLHD